MCGILGTGCAPSTSSGWLRAGEATSELSTGKELPPVYSQPLWGSHGREKKEQQYQSGQAQATSQLPWVVAGNNTVGCSDPSSPGYLLKLLQMSSAMGKSLSPQPNHPTQLQSLDSNYPSLWYNLSSPVLYSPDPMPGSLFPKASPLHLSSCLASGLSLLYLTFCLLNSTLLSFQLPALNLCHSRHNDFYLTHPIDPHNPIH